MEKKDIACAIFEFASHYFLVKEGVRKPDSFSDLFAEVAGVPRLESKNEYVVVPRKRRSMRSNKGVFTILEDAIASKPINEGSKNSLKRKAKKEKSTSKPTKKRKNNNNNDDNSSDINVVDQLQQEQPLELPMEFKEKIEELEGNEVKLVIQKKLTKSDLSANNGRFSIPKGKVQEKNFLTPTEESLLDVREGEHKRLSGVSVSVLDPSLNLHDNMCFKKWEMKTTEVYNITSGWNKLAAENFLEVNDKVQLWSFRSKHQLYFALVKL